MLNMLKNLLRKIKSIQLNNTGNVLPVALIVVTVLTFSVTTMTGMTINLVNNTTSEAENLNEENEAKSKIRLAIQHFETWLTDNNFDFDAYNIGFENQPENTFGVTVTEEDLGDTNGLDSHKYRFAVTLSDGRDLVMYEWVSNSGVETVEFTPFNYTIGTNADLIINSGYFESTKEGKNEHPIKIFARDLYTSRISPFLVNTTGNHKLSSQSNSISKDPVFTNDIAEAEIYISGDALYCNDSSNNGDECFDIEDNSVDPSVPYNGYPFIMDKSKYDPWSSTTPVDQGQPGPIQFIDFFAGFLFSEYVEDYINNKAPSDKDKIKEKDGLIEWESLAAGVYSYSDPLEKKNNGDLKWPKNSLFIDVTEYWEDVDWSKDIDKEGTLVYFGNDPAISNLNWPYEYEKFNGDSLDSGAGPLTITTKFNTKDNTLVVFGDLYIDTDDMKEIKGDIFVTGDLYFRGKSKKLEGTIIVLGETFVQLDNEHQFLEQGKNDGITLVTMDNIHFESHDVTYNPTAPMSDEFYMFIYTEESIYINAIDGRLNFAGVMYAKGAGLSGNYIPLKNGEEQVHGIFINSLYGYVDENGGFYSGIDENFRFRIAELRTKKGNMSKKFDDLPEFSSQVVNVGEWTFYSTQVFEIE